MAKSKRKARGVAKSSQDALGDELFGTPMGAASDTEDVAPDLDAIQEDSERQELPAQEKLFQVSKRVRSKLHNLPDATRPPLGFVPGRGFDAVFPFIKLPSLTPNLNGDWVQFGSPDLEPNRLYYGDNLQVLRTLRSKSIDLIYIDPPFFSGAEYNVIWGDTNEVRTFSDIWEGGLDTYLIWLNARLWEMRRVLRDTGSIYVHCDWHASHYIKGELDKIFGYENFRNEIVWRRTNAKGLAFTSLPKNHDVLLYYAKSDELKFNRVFREHDEDYLKRFYRHVEEGTGRRYRISDLTNPNTNRPNLTYEWKGHTRVWRWTKERMGEADARGLIHYSSTGLAAQKRFLDEMEGQPVDALWDDIQPVQPQSDERLGYPTQKPEALLERIVEASTDEGDMVADFFCGGGVTPAVAHRLRRRWIACDSSRVAISVTLNRLVGLGEEQSGVKSNYGQAGQVQQKLDLPTPENAVPDIRVHYVGVYPVDRFKAVEEDHFQGFILGCLGAQKDASESAITGWRSAREPLRVGLADPDKAADAKDVQAFFEAVVKQLQPNVRTVARYVCWRASPELTAYRRKLADYIRRNIQPRGADLVFEFLLIDSEEFRERIRQKYPDAEDNEFLLRFTKEPVIGEIAATRLGPRKYRFEARDADSTNAGGYLVNCQWDFSYQRGHFAADSKYVLCRSELKGKEAKVAGHKFEAVLEAEHTFDSAGSFEVACRVQDNLGAEAIHVTKIGVE